MSSEAKWAWTDTEEFKVAAAEMASDYGPSEVQVYDGSGRRLFTLFNSDVTGPVSKIYFSDSKTDRWKELQATIAKFRDLIRGS
jgi:hypothetical protein